MDIRIDEYVEKFGGVSRFVRKIIDSFDCPFAIVNAVTREVEITNSKEFFPGIKCNALFKCPGEGCSEKRCPIDGVVGGKKSLITRDVNAGTPLEIHAHPIFGPSGEVVSVILYGLDIAQTQALEESEAKFHSLFEGSVDAIFIADPKTKRLVDCNAAAMELIACSKEDLLGMPIVDLVPKDRRKEALDTFIKHSKGEQIILETEILKSDGKTRVPVSINTSVIVINGVMFLQGIFRDISKRRKAEESTRESERVLRYISEGTSGVTGEPFLNNLMKSLTEALGFKYGIIGKLVNNGKDVKTIVFWNDGKRGPDFVYEIKGTPCEEAAGREVCFYSNNVCKHFPEDKDLLDFGAQSYLGVPLKNSSGDVIGVLNVFHDKSVEDRESCRDVLNIFANKVVAELERKESEKELIAKDAVFEMSLGANSISDAEGVLIYVNESFLKIWGFRNQKEAIGKPIPYFFQDVDAAKEVLEALNKNGKWTGEFVAKRRDGTTFVAYGLATTVLDRDGKLTGYQSSILDITENKRAERELKESKEKYKHLVENIPDVAWIMSKKRGAVFISSNVKNTYGYTSSEICENRERFWFGRIHKNDIRNARGALRDFFVKGEKYDIEYRIQRKDGEWIWLHDRSTGVYEKNGEKYADGIFSDITERKRAEEILKEKDGVYVREIEDRFHNILQNSQDLVYRYDFRKNCFDYVSESVFTILGYSLNEFMKMNMNDYNKRIHPDDVGILSDMGNVSEGESVSVVEYRFKKKNGDYAWLKVRRAFFRDKDGELIYSVEDIRDITEEKSAGEERTRLRERLMQIRAEALEKKERISLTAREKFVLWGICRYPMLSDEELANKLDLKRSTLTAIKNRLKGNWFNVSYIPNFCKLGCQFFTIFDANFKGGNIKSLDLIKKNPNVVLSNYQDDKLLAGFTSDRYVDVKKLMEQIAGDDALINSLNENSFFYGLDNVFLYDVSELVNSLFGLKKREKSVVCKFENEAAELSVNEKRVLHAIIKDPEMSSTEIAKKIWTSKPTVIKVKKKLLEENYIHPYVVPDFRKMGFSYFARLSFEFDSDLSEILSEESRDVRVILQIEGKKKMTKIMLFASEEEYEEEIVMIREGYRKRGIGFKLNNKVFPIQKRRSKNSKVESFVNDRLFGDAL